MSDGMARIRILMPKEFVDEIDRFVGPRHRSEFVSDAVEEKVSRERLCRAALRLGGSLADKDIPGWESTESAAGWVNSLRRESDQSPRKT